MNHLIFGHLGLAGRIFVGLLVFVVGLIFAKLTASISSKSEYEKIPFLQSNRLHYYHYPGECDRLWANLPCQQHRQPCC
jgi:hypothetical protein